MSASSPEPMSPGSPVINQSIMSDAHTPYLPGFLLGDHSPPSTMNSFHQENSFWSQKTSPMKNRSLLTKPTSPENSSRRVTFSPLPAATRIVSHRSAADKHGGPPVQGLFDQTYSPARNNANTSSHKQLNRSIFTNSTTQNPNAMNNYIYNDTSLIDESILERSVNASEDDRVWVTIYGFPPNAASFLLQQFSQYGTICKHKMADKGNWMHVCYQSKLQAKRAISKNSKIIGGSLMVGVKLCDDKNVIDDGNKENSEVSILRDSGMDQTKASSFNRSGSIRPLTQAYKVAMNDREVCSSATIPQKSNSVIAKAMDYVFGW